MKWILPVLLFCVPANAQSLPPHAIPVTASAVGTTDITTVELPALPSMITYLCGFTIDASATAGTLGNATITGTMSGTLNFTQAVGTAPVMASINRAFNPCLSGASVNTPITVNSIAPGAGGKISVTAWGFQLQ